MQNYVGTEGLREAILTYPNHRVLFLYPEEGCGDYYYTYGDVGTVEIGKYVTIDDRTFNDSDELREYYGDLVADDLYLLEEFPLTEAQEDKIDEEVDKIMGTVVWTDAIFAFIGPAVL